MKIKLANLNHDISCLIAAFNTAKKTGRFELKNVFLKEISPERLNGCFAMDDQSKRVHFADSNGATVPMEYLKAELSHREEIIASLEQELKTIRGQYESLVNGLSEKESALNTMKCTLSSIHNKEIMANNQVFDSNMEIRRLKNELNDYRSKMELADDELQCKKKEAHDLKVDLCSLTSEVKSLRSDLVAKDKQICMLKDRLNDLDASSGSIGYSRCKTPVGAGGSGLSNQDIHHYERRIQDLKLTIDELQNDKIKQIEEISQLQLKLKSIHNASQSDLDAFKAENRAKDDMIQKMKQDLIMLQEKRDMNLSEIESHTSRIQQLENRLYYLEDENIHLSNRLKQAQKEIQDWKLSYDELTSKNECNMTKFTMYDETLHTLKEQFSDSQAQNQKLTFALQSVQTAAKEAREKIGEELAKKQDEITKLRDELKTLEITHQAHLREKEYTIEQLNNDLAQANTKKSKQLDDCNQEIATLKARCEEQDKELEKFKTQLNKNETSANSQLTTLNSQLAEKDENITKLTAEVNNSSLNN